LIVLFFSDIPWYGLHQRPQHITEALAKKWPVLWIEPTTLVKKSHFRPLTVAPNIHIVSIPIIPYNARFPWMRAVALPLSHVPGVRTIVTMVQRFLIRRALRLLGKGERVAAVVNYFHAIDVLDKLPTSFLLYDYIDNAFGFVKLPDHVKQAWEKTIRKANVITVTSEELARQLQPLRSTGITYVGNGVEYEHFAHPKVSECPPDVKRGQPIVCYCGAVYPWLDYDLLRYTLKEMPDVHFLFLGPVHPDIEHITRELSAMGNSSFPGFKPYAMLPQYFKYIDVGIIPFQLNDLTRSVNPVKLYEYSAAGKPTVATQFSGDLLPFSDKIFLARSKEEFVSQLRLALKQSHDPAVVSGLQSFARQHDWSTKTSVIADLLNHHHH